jgi:malate synthase
VQATTANVDAELALQAGPQLVVPILNARYALNAANARWGSLYDALYGTDAMPETGGAERGNGAYNPARGAKVIAFARRLLDQAAPLAEGSHNHSRRYRVDGGQLLVTLADGHMARAGRPGATGGLPGRPGGAAGGAAAAPRPAHRHRIDRTAAIGKADPAGISDVVLEAALSTILDLEDSRRRGGRRGQDPGLPQLAGHPEGHADRRGEQEAARPSRAA